MSTPFPILLRADFNGLFSQLLCLSHKETCVGEDGQDVIVHEGMIVTAFDEDVDDDGRTCTLSRQPDKYKDSLVRLQVRVKRYRHGTSISDPSCPKQGIVLITSQSADQTTSVSHFYQFLQEHRPSKIPIFATITGRLVADSDSGFVKRDVVFKLESVSGVSEGDQTGQQ